uniref:Methyltransferase type 11 domain-containing protein n=1 Tax=Tetraodon nigroviridis TaxID=99883 RepID=H3DAQ0_TETNG
MTLLMRLCTLVVHVLCLPLHLIDAVGLYKLYKHVIPGYMYQISIAYNKKMHDKKKELFRSLADFKPGGQLTLLEIGCGTGTNFQYYPSGCRVVCTDPNPNFQKYLTRAMEDNDHLTYDRFAVASGEDMAAVQDNSVDAVVCTLVLCSVDSVAQTLREVHRILRPGGAFFFMEHVVADPSTWCYFFQHVLQPPWYYFGDGCQVTRETWKNLESAGFSELQLRHIEAPLMFMIKPHIVGYAVK